MDIKVLGIDLGKTVCSLAGLGWTRRERSCFGNACSDIVFWTFWASFRAASLRWRPAAAPITSAAIVFRMCLSLG